MNSIEQYEAYKRLESYLRSEIDIHTLVNEFFYDSIIELIYSVEFGKLPENPNIENFLKAGLDIYKKMHRLNYRLHRYGEGRDIYLNYVIACHMMEQYPDCPAICKFLGVAEYPDNPDARRDCRRKLAREISMRLVSYEQKNMYSEQLRDSIAKAVRSQFDDTMFEIMPLEHNRLMIKAKNNDPVIPGETFGDYLLRFMRQKGIENNISHIARQMGSESYRSTIVNLLPNASGGALREPSKDMIYRLSFAMSLSWHECLDLFKAARIEYDKYTGTDEKKAEQKKRDELIMDLLIFGREAVLVEGSSDVIGVAVRNILLRNGMKPLEPREGARRHKKDDADSAKK